MDEYILKQIDELPNDCILINNGDLFLNSRMDYEKLKNYYIPRMKGSGRELWIILGNHDRTATKYVKNCPYDNAFEMYVNMGFDRVEVDPIIIDEKFILSHEPVYIKPGSNFINLYGHVHNIDISSDYFCHECENWAMMEVVKSHPELTKQTNLDIDTKKISNPKLTVNPDYYFNVCWDKHHKILPFTEVIEYFENLRTYS